MNNHDENKKYFKSTFKVFHAPDNIAKEVLDMAKKLNQEDNTNGIKNTNQETVSYQAENVSHNNFGQWIAIACACVLVVGSGLYFNNLDSENVANQIVTTQIEDNSTSLGQSTQVDIKLFGRFDMPSQVDAKLLAHSSENSDITCYLTSQDLTKLNPLINYENWIEVSTYPAEFDNDVIYPYFAEIDFQTNDGEYIRLEIVDQYVLIYHTDENYEHYSNSKYYQYDFNNDISFFETFKQLLENNATQQVATLFGAVEISTNADFIGSNMYGDISVNGYLNDDIIDKLNELSNISEWTETDLSSIGDDINIAIDISSTSSDRTFKTAYNFIIQDNVAIVTQNDGSQKCYIVPDTLAYDMITILNESNVENQVDNSKLFGIIPMYENTSFNAVINSSTSGESACILNYQDLLKINELSCYDTWQQLTNNPIGENQNFEINVILKNDNCSIQILDTTIIVTYPDDTVEYYSTMETCGTDTFAQRVQSLVYERSQTQIIE